MWEVMTQGPVQAVIQVHTDLFLYSSGVYSLSQEGAGRLAGHHGVKIIGWGETPGMEGAQGEQFWVVTNSWGKQWGENGTLRIRQQRHGLHGTRRPLSKNFKEFPIRGIFCFKNLVKKNGAHMTPW